MVNTTLRDELRQGLQALALTVEPAQIDSLLQYLELLQRWNQVYNLTAIREPEAMLVHHLLDSLAVVQPLAAGWTQMGGHAQPYPARVMDVGTGAGVPGLILALLWPQTQVHLVEPVGKKTAFLEKAVGALGLRARVQVHQKRVEDLTLEPAPDLIVCRAFASLADFTTGVAHLVAPHTQVAAMKAQWPDDEVAELREAGLWQVVAHARFAVPQLDAQRRIMWLAPVAD